MRPLCPADMNAALSRYLVKMKREFILSLNYNYYKSIPVYLAGCKTIKKKIIK